MVNFTLILDRFGSPNLSYSRFHHPRAKDLNGGHEELNLNLSPIWCGTTDQLTLPPLRQSGPNETRPQRGALVKLIGLTIGDIARTPRGIASPQEIGVGSTVEVDNSCRRRYI
jgi:hypothetical protein